MLFHKKFCAASSYTNTFCGSTLDISKFSYLNNAAFLKNTENIYICTNNLLYIDVKCLDLQVINEHIYLKN